MANYFRYIHKDASRLKFKKTTAETYLASTEGTILAQDYPLQSSISFDFFPNPTDPTTTTFHNADPDKLRLKALEPISKSYIKYSNYFNFSTQATECSDLGLDFYHTNIMMVSIPSIFFGEKLKPGSIKLTTYADGVPVSVIGDTNRNGELRYVSGIQINSADSVAGLVYYNLGVIVLFDDTALASYKENFYVTDDTTPVPDYPRWSNWGISSLILKNNVVRTSYDLEFDGINNIPQVTMLAHADVGEANYSNNRTFLKKYEDYDNLYTFSRDHMKEFVPEIQNIAKTEYSADNAVFEKETYISKILIYDEHMNVIAEAKLAKPIRKTEGRNFTFKLKLDL